MSERLVLATDLDGTIAGGSDAARAELAALLTGTAGVRFVYVTGRTPPAAEELITRVRLPTPDVLIADVGTS
ncbi:MAG: HAD family hydrolase, partial [Longimicrobiales bacterium]